MNSHVKSGRSFSCICLLFIAALIVGCETEQKLADGSHVYLPGGWGYTNQRKTFSVTEEQAATAARQAADQRGQAVLSEKPLAIVDDYYLFGTPNPRGVWLTGYYVNGQTGEVEYRRPDRIVYFGFTSGLLEH